jgi:hypothetical protein
MKRKTYYHVIEEGHYNEVASHGCFDTIEEARNESNRLSNLFNELSFWVYESDTQDEPVICTI